MKCQMKHIFMSSVFFTGDLWNRLCGLSQKKMLKVNFVNVILGYETWVRSHYSKESGGIF